MDDMLRDVVVRIQQRGRTTWEETVTINRIGNVVYHSSGGCQVYEGPSGRPIRTVFVGLSDVVFTGKFVLDKEVVDLVVGQRSLCGLINCSKTQVRVEECR